MRIMVDGKNLSLREGTGVATYARNVCEVARRAGHEVDVLYGEPFGAAKNLLLREIAFFDVPTRVSGFGTVRNDLKAYLSPLRTARPFPVPLDGRVISRPLADRLPTVDGLWNAANVFRNADLSYPSPLAFGRGFNRVDNANGWDVAHWTFPIPLTLRNALNIYTIHDLVPLRLPYATLDHKRTFYRMIDRIAKDADLILTVSEESRRDIRSFFDIPDERIVNTHQSVHLPDRHLLTSEASLADELRNVHDLRFKDYILFYGAIEPKKNVGRLIEAYLSAGLDIPLVVVGKDGWLIGTDLDAIDDPANSDTIEIEGIRKTRRKIRRRRHVTFAQLIQLVRGARLVALPSIYEGFGLPIVEAMICGTPVLTSNLGATREIAGDAALLVDPYDIRDIKEGLARLAGDPDLRAELAARGRRRAADFAPERFAARLDAAYRQAAAVGRARR